MILGLQLSIRVREFAGGIPPATPIRTSLPITWTDNSAIEDGYRIRWDPTAGGTIIAVDIGKNLQNYTIGGLLFNTQYDVEVAAFNGLGESLALGPIILYTAPPAAPTLCTATATGATTANVGWTLPGVEPITGYRVYRSPAAAGTWTAAGTVAAGVATLGVTGLIAATAYDFRVVAYNSNAAVSQPDSETAPSNTATTTTSGGLAAFSDDFSGTLSNWTTDAGSWSIAAAKLKQDTTGWATDFIHHNTPCTSINQYAKFQTIDANGGNMGVRFRAGSSGTGGYQVIIPGSSGNFSWEGTDTAMPGGIANNDTFGVTITGTGNGTIVRVWKNPTGLPVSPSNWDGDVTPDITFTNDPASPIDTGLYIGFAGASGGGNGREVYGFFGGDCP